MQLKKRFTEDAMAVSSYTGDGIALGIVGKGDKFMNSIALVEYIEGELRLVLFDDAIERYGIKIGHENINPKEW